MKSVFQTCQPRPEVVEGNLYEGVFAARFRVVIEGQADPVYQNPRIFFENTYPTQGIAPIDGAAYEALCDGRLLEVPFPGPPCYSWYFVGLRPLEQPVLARGGCGSLKWT